MADKDRSFQLWAIQWRLGIAAPLGCKFRQHNTIYLLK
jgi:hypothetical protein